MSYDSFLRESSKAELISFVDNYSAHIKQVKKLSEVISAEEFFNKNNQAEASED